MQEKSLKFTVEEIIWEKNIQDKVKEHKYNSRSELIRHISTEDFEPEQSKLPRLIKENKELKQKLEEAENTIISLVFGKELDDNFVKRKLQEGKITTSDIQLKMPDKANKLLN